MSPSFTSIETKKLLLQFVIKEIAYEKESKKLAELVHLSNQDISMKEALSTFFQESLIDGFHVSHMAGN